ncbi:recombinase family protein [Mesorhizobium sp. M1217]|uniref:recombinase family protein n=1 Tax=Mesorhizobium sp. M1217 TaxID=2957070 RepID=UPI00333AAD5D
MADLIAVWRRLHVADCAQMKIRMEETTFANGDKQGATYPMVTLAPNPSLTTVSSMLNAIHLAAARAKACDVELELTGPNVGTLNKSALAYLRPDDVLVVWKLDRLGRSLVEMMRTIDTLRRQEIKFLSLTEHFDCETAHGRFALQMHGAMAEYYLDLNRERTIEGLRSALARGRKGGRRKKLGAGDIEAAGAMLKAGTIPVADVAKRMGVSRTTFYSYFPSARSRQQ